jgi:hypothetical protein
MDRWEGRGASIPQVETEFQPHGSGFSKQSRTVQIFFRQFLSSRYSDDDVEETRTSKQYIHALTPPFTYFTLRSSYDF